MISDKHRPVDKISTWDILVVIGYFIIILGTSFYSTVKNKRNTIDSYFLAGRKMTWVFVGASLFASNIGSEHFIGLAGSGAASGLGVGAFELNAMIIIQILGWVFLPVFIASSVATLPEYMNKRFGGNRIRVYLSVLSLILYIFTKISVNLYSGALFIKIALGWDLYYSVLLVLGMTGLCTITGGLAAVIYTETIQTVIMIAGGLTLMGFSFYQIGGYENLYLKYMDTSHLNVSNPSIQCALPKANSFQMLRDLHDTDMPWLGFLLGQTPSSIWYWCSDQMMVQRTLAAKSLSHAQGGTLFAGYLKILPLFMIVIPGMISRALFPDTVGCSDPQSCMEVCDSPNGCSNIAYPMLIMKVMPVGLKGLMLAVMLAALMSDLTSIFNSSATLFTVDIYRQIRKDASNKQLMIAGRLFVLFMVLVGIIWIPVIKNMQGAQLYIYIQSVAAYLSPPIAAVYLLAVLWKRANEKGAFWSLMIGMFVGLIRMILDFVYHEKPCGEVDDRPGFVKNFHYLYFAVMLFWITALSMVVISLLTEKSDAYRLIRTTYWTRKIADKRPDESDDYRTLDQSIEQNSEVILNEIELKDEKKKEEQDDKSECVNTFLNFVCGFEEITGESEWMRDQKFLMQKKIESKRRVENFYSLNQAKKSKILLNVNLVIILLIASGLYIFFSIPPQYHIFKDLKLNTTLNSR
ncbi:unnamed protein product [Brachionus calyciflorus]|uniref:Sodium/myo-inositol cotransporter n=1 Tax=Brachionus calyciflorus TaxID=104777 RepID=A0A813QDI6_9BILA|nr:unnamed protein product [Brachionus calyciflorus]